MAKRKLPVDTKWFKYDNVNPNNRHTCDCVIRALCTALEIDYFTALDELVEITKKTGWHPTSKEAIAKRLDTYEKIKQPKHNDGKKFTGKQFCETYNKGTYICFIGTHHITVVKDGMVHDIWDCTDKYVGSVWKIK